jgi:hypothetical protein
MILEVAILEVRTGSEQPFEVAFYVPVFEA